jgi:hypothetical protein
MTKTTTTSAKKSAPAAVSPSNKDNGIKSKSKSKSVQKSIRTSSIKPRSKSGARSLIHSFQTKVPEIVISYAARKSDPNIGAFIKPMMDYVSQDIDCGGVVSEIWKVTTICPRRLMGGVNSPMTISPDLPYEWEAIVSINEDEGITAEDIGENIAKYFSAFSDDSYEKQGFRYEAPTERDDEKPVNYYLLDIDCLLLLRSIYSTATKEELVADENIMQSFFGSEQIGQRVLGNLSKLAWENIIN